MSTPKHTAGPWYESSTGNHQGLIASEATGENVAVSYDKADAPLIAAAPELLEALEAFVQGESEGHGRNIALALARDAITKAGG